MSKPEPTPEPMFLDIPLYERWTPGGEPIVTRFELDLVALVIANMAQHGLTILQGIAIAEMMREAGHMMIVQIESHKS